MSNANRKDKILNTRIPEELDRELREHAKKLDVPVSELVRGMLQRTVNLVGNLSGNVENLVQDIREDVEGLRKLANHKKPTEVDRWLAQTAEVIGWQQIQLHKPARCALSGATLRSGDAAHLGLSADGTAPMLISDETFRLLLGNASRAEVYAQIRLHRAAVCARTGVAIAAGELAYFRAGSQPPEIVCEEEFERLVADGSAVASTGG